MRMSGRPTWARWVTRISLGIAIVALIFTIRDLGLRALAKYFRMIGWWWIAVLVLEVTITSLDAVAIRAFLSPEHSKVRFRATLLSQLAGRAVNAVTPGGNLGEAVKVSVLTDYVSQSRAVSTILFYNIVSFTVELATVAVAAPFMALLVPMPTSLRWLMLAVGLACFLLAIALNALVRHGVLATLARIAKRIPVPGLALVRRRLWNLENPSRYLLSQERYESWRGGLAAVDDNMHVSTGARARDRWLGIAAVVLSRGTSMTLSLLILHAVGEPITLGFVAAYTVGGFAIYLLSSLVPMGLGISEGGNYALFRALGYNPARGVTLVLARRVTLIVYAAIGLVLVTASETVKRAKARHLPVRQLEVAPASAPPLSVNLPVTSASQVAAAHVTDVAD
ncbi:MAG: hypothetical protein JWO36_1350 [Myxococcales bacterium]|nr:hypothetical protein [Myxococcales bacterium]